VYDDILVVVGILRDEQGAHLRHQRLVTIAQRPQLLGGKVGHLGVRRQRLGILYCRLCVAQLSERGHNAFQLRPFASDLLKAQVIGRD
jgi:hypothetical protein